LPVDGRARLALWRRLRAAAARPPWFGAARLPAAIVEARERLPGVILWAWSSAPRCHGGAFDVVGALPRGEPRRTWRRPQVGPVQRALAADW